MFEHYMSYQYANPRMRRTMGFAALVSGTLTMSIVTFAWAANKMDIAKVDAPTSDYLIFQLSMDESPPPPPPPPAASSSNDEVSEKPQTEDIPEEAPPEESVAPPSEAPKNVPKPRSGGGSKVPGVPGGSSIGMIGAPIITTIGDPPIRRRRELEDKAPPPRPISSVMSQGLFTPDPDMKRLKATKAGMFDKRPCKNKTSFCVDASGKVVDVRTSGKCYDPQVDAVCRDAVKRWRFKPFIIAGVAKKTCSTVHFDLKFGE